MFTLHTLMFTLHALMFTLHALMVTLHALMVTLHTLMFTVALLHTPGAHRESSITPHMHMHMHMHMHTPGAHRESSTPSYRADGAPAPHRRTQAFSHPGALLRLGYYPPTAASAPAASDGAPHLRCEFATPRHASPRLATPRHATPRHATPRCAHK